MKIIILTASSKSDQELDQFVKRGVRVCLRKPVAMEHLYKTVLSCV